MLYAVRVQCTYRVKKGHGSLIDIRLCQSADYIVAISQLFYHFLPVIISLSTHARRSTDFDVCVLFPPSDGCQVLQSECLMSVCLKKPMSKLQVYVTCFHGSVLNSLTTMQYVMYFGFLWMTSLEGIEIES